MEWLFFTRFGEAFLPNYYNEETWRWLDEAPDSIKAKIGQIYRHGVIHGTGYDEIPDDLTPETNLLDTAHGSTVPDDFVEYIKDGAIDPKKATVDRVDADGLQLSTGEYVDADVIILATGHENRYPFLDDDIELRDEQGDFALYRGIVPPETDGLGIIGRRELFNNFLSMHLSAHWLSDYFQGELTEMPTTQEMYESIHDRNEWMRTLMPNNKGYDFGGYHYHACDELLIDMGVPTKRRNNFVTEWFGLNMQGKWYDGLGEERRERTAESSSESTLHEAAKPYLSSAHVVLGAGVLTLVESLRHVFE
jgi:hypothetical protein